MELKKRGNIFLDKTARIKLFQFFIFIFIFGLIFFSSSVFSAGNDYTIIGDSVVIDDENIFINITPHTGTQPLIEFKSKVYSGDVDIVVGFDTERILPTSAKANPHLENITKSYTCNGYFNYTQSPKHAWCYENITTYDESNMTNGSYLNLVFERDFDSGNQTSKTIYWEEEEIVWNDVSGAFEVKNVDFMGFDKWYVKEGFNINIDQLYQLKLSLNPVSQTEPSYKYFFGIKPSSETLSEAIANNHFYFIDPWSGSGDGTVASPYQITSWAELNETRDNLTANYILMNDLDAGDTGYNDIAGSSANGGIGWKQIGDDSAGNRFTGNFSGQNYTLSDIYMSNSETAVGLFAEVSKGATIRELGLLNMTAITSADQIGGISGKVGGLIINSYVQVNRISGANNAGGITGFLNGTINNSYTYGGNITASTNYGGGIAGVNYLGIIQNSYSNVSVNGVRVGGLIGEQYYTDSDTIDSYAAGVIYGTNTGGLIGSSSVQGDIIASYYDSDVSGQSDSGRGVGKTTAQMQTFETFSSDWDIALDEDWAGEIWYIENATDYPRLGIEREVAGGDETNPNVTINSPLNQTYSGNEIVFNITCLDETAVSSAWGTINGGIANFTLTNTTSASNYNFTNSSVPDGSYTFQVYCNDTSNNINDSESIVFSMDGTFPLISSIYPDQYANYSFANVGINYSLIEANSGACWWTNNSGVTNQSLTCGNNISGINWAEGSNEVIVYANDTAGNENSTTFNFNIDLTLPSPSIPYPTNNSIFNSKSHTINISIGESNPNTCIWSNDSFATNNTLTCGNNITGIDWEEGDNNIDFWMNDSAGNQNQTSIYFLVDTIIPVPTFTYPLNNSDFTTAIHTLNLSIIEENTAICLWSNDSFTTNNTITCRNNITATWEQGENNIDFWMNDSAGNVNQTSINFFIDSIVPEVIFISQTPVDLNVYNAFDTGINVTYNVSDINLNADAVQLFQLLNTTTENNPNIYINGTLAFGGNFVTGFTDDSNDSNVWTFHFDDNNVYPARYNFNEAQMESTAHVITKLDGLNKWLKVELLNVSNDKNFNTFEFMINSSGTQAMPIYYCNSSYSTGNPTSDDNCVLFYNQDQASPYNHSHVSESWHYTAPFVINTTSNQILGIDVTSTSYFLFKGNAGANQWDAYYITNKSRTGAIQSTINNGIAWSEFDGTLDVHLHQFDGTETLRYYVCANDTLNNQNCSSTRLDLLQTGGLPPLPPSIITPTNGYYYGNITINYTAATLFNGQNVSHYNISLLNIDETFNQTILGNVSTNLSFVWDSSFYNKDNYIIKVEVYDTQGLSSFALSENFTTIENLNGSFGDVWWIKNSSFITNISTSDYILFNNTGASDYSVNVYNLTDGLVWYSNGSSTNEITDNINITLYSGNYSYVFNRFNVTEDTTRANSPISLQGITSTEIELDSEIDINNIKVYISEDCAYLTNIEYFEFGEAAITQSYSCISNLVSMTVNNITSATSGQYFKIYRDVPAPSGGGSGSTSYTPTTIINETIVINDTVEDLKIKSRDDFKFGITNYIDVEVLNIDNELIDVDEIKSEIIEDLYYSKDNFVRTGVGSYEQKIKINESSIEEFTIEVGVLNNNEWFYENKTFTITKPTEIEVFSENTKSFFQKLADSLQKNWGIVLIVILSILLIILIAKALSYNKN